MWTPILPPRPKSYSHVGKRAIPQLVIDGEWFQPYKPGRGLLFEELYRRLQIPRTIAR